MLSICYHDEESTKKYFPHLDGQLIHVCGESSEVYHVLASRDFAYLGHDDDTTNMSEAFITIDNVSEYLDLVIFYNNYINNVL